MPVDPSPYVLEVEPLYLGADVKAVGLELIDRESREPARGADAARIWAAALPVLAAAEPWVLDFFSHLEREDRKSTRLNSSHGSISYAVFCLKKKNIILIPIH